MDETYEQNQRPALIRPIRAIPQDPEKKKERIKAWVGVVLVLFALGVDISELVITWLGLVVVGGVLSTIVSLIAGFVFWICFMLLGIPSFSNPKQLAVKAGTFIGELIPFLDAIPFLSFLWTIGTIVIVLMVRAEDRGGFLGKAANMAQGKIKP